jgi:hypothetical protein
MKQHTISEFSQKIRTKYPGSYDDISDEKLIELWLNKYPKDKEHVIEDSNSGSGSFLYKWISGIVFIVVLFFTNPNSNDHKMAVNEVFNQSINKTGMGEILKSTAGEGVQSMVNSFFKTMIDECVTRKSYVLFSITSLNNFSSENSSQIIGFGILGKVFISDEVGYEIENKINDYKNNAGSILNLLK